MTKSKKKTAADDPDFYLPVLQRHWEALTGMYLAFGEHAPVLELEIATGLIRAYPAFEYLAELSDRTRESARQQYQEVVADGSMMVFVRDEPRRILRSYIFDAPTRVSKRAKRATGAGSAQRRRPRAEEIVAGPHADIEGMRIQATLHAIYDKHRRMHRENPDSGQMCCMWSTDDPPDVILDTEPLCDIEDAFDIQISDSDALSLYDMKLAQAAHLIRRLIKKQT